MAKKKKSWMPDYAPSASQREAYNWCVSHGIQISPGGTTKNQQWTIDIKTPNHDWTKSPKTYGKDEIWKSYYRICKYYYDKRELTIQ